jgi:hypothetical protein
MQERGEVVELHGYVRRAVALVQQSNGEALRIIDTAVHEVT